MMEQFQEVRDKAKRNIQIADHMLGVTFPLVKDPKLLLAILDNLFLAYSNAISAIIYHDRLFKKVPPFQDNFESKFNIFKERSIITHKLDKSYLQEIQDLKDILSEHKKSPLEFSRKDRFFICSDNYHMKSVGINEITKYLSKAKIFIEEVDNILKKNERIFK